MVLATLSSVDGCHTDTASSRLIARPALPQCPLSDSVGICSMKIPAAKIPAAKVLAAKVLAVAPLVCLMVVFCPDYVLTQDVKAAVGDIQFARDIQPILSEHCYACHGTDPESREAGLRLDLATAWTEELESGEGKAIVPGNADDSVLMYRVNSTDYDQMPPEDYAKPLSESQKDLLQRWINGGAQWQRHWAYDDLHPQVPDVLPPATAEDGSTVDTSWTKRWTQKPIDRLVARKLLEAGADGLTPSPTADPITLVRRLHFDLTGLPPQPEVVAAFAADPSPDAYEKMVDQLLSTPAHAEHMTRYWLDWVRYADTVGYHGDQEHAIWPYRDYVIKSFAENKPFDQFTLEQLAGDLLPNATEEQLVASAYNRLLQTTHEGGAQDLEYREKYLADRVRNFSEVWLAATLGCAQCHDHKYDPLTQNDFYSLGAFFADLDERGSYDGVAPNSTPTLRHPQKQVISPLDQQRVPENLDSLVEQRFQDSIQSHWDKVLREKRQRSQSDDPTTVTLSDREKDRAAGQYRQQVRNELLNEHRIRFGQCMYSRSVQAREVRLLPRGDWLDRSGPVVHPATPESMPALALPVGTGDQQPTRLHLAQWLFQDDNPLPARVLANRLWYVAFHKGLSSNLGDFGMQGHWPTHPVLLDYLADRLRRSDWNIRVVLREIVLSETYQQSSLVTGSEDPENIFYARQNRPRLSAEEIRDNALCVSGLLVDQVGGPSVKPYQPKGYYRSLNFPVRTYQPSSGDALYRRGVYVHWQRQFLHPMLKAFDAPTREECTAERAISNTPSAALVLLNDPEFVEAARQLAVSSLQKATEDAEQSGSSVRSDVVISAMFQRVLSRDPDKVELERLQLLYEAQVQRAKDESDVEKLLDVATPLSQLTLEKEGLALADLFGMTQVARVLLNLDETITRY